MYWTSLLWTWEVSESFNFAAEIFTCSLGQWIVPRRPTLRSGICCAEENLRPCVELRKLLPGKETRSAEENLERPKTDASGIYSGAAERQQRGTWLRGCVLPIWISSLTFNDRLYGLATGVYLRCFLDWICLRRISKPFLYQGIGSKLQERRWKRFHLGSRSCPSMRIDWPKPWGRAFASNSNLGKRFRRLRVLALRAFFLNVPGRPAPREPAKGRIFSQTLTIRVRTFC